VATDPSGLGGWSYGLHPNAAGATIQTMTRVQLPLGNALRLEMTDRSAADVVHVQYFIASESGAWALWVSCAPSQLGEREELLAMIEAPEELTT
jgi:hypothetical protein